VIIIGLALIAVRGLNMGVDFKGGRSYIVSFSKPVVATDVKVALASGFENAGTEVKNFGNDKVMKVTTSYLIGDESDKADDKVKAALIDGVSKFSGLQYSENDAQIDDTHFTISSSSKVGATIADDIKGSALEAGLFSIIAIFLYILVRFRKWQYSAGAIIALIHDTLILTVIGYSINDTVIIFDRIREFIAFGSSHDRNRIFNDAINSTLSRTLITSGTTLIVVVVLLIFGGEVLRGFSFALLVGIGIGTYSSIFIAAPIVVDFDKSKDSNSKPEVKTVKA